MATPHPIPLAPPRGKLTLHRDQDKTVSCFYRVNGSVVSLSDYDVNSVVLDLSPSRDSDADETVTLTGAISADKFQVAVTPSDLTDLPREGIWRLSATKDTGATTVVIAYGDEVGDLVIKDGPA